MNEKNFAELFRQVRDATLANVPGVQQDQVRKTMIDLVTNDPSTSEPVVLLGYHTPGDGGGGVFEYDSIEAKANHDGGRVINADLTYASSSDYGTFVNASGGAGSGCWMRIANTWAPEMWGAWGDGGTDDSDAWNRFSAYLASNGGKGVLNGSYKLNDADTTEINSTEPMELEGTSDAIVLDGRNGDAALFDLTKGGLTVRNIKLLGISLFLTNKETSQSFDHVILENVRFDNTCGDVRSAALRLLKSGSTVPKLGLFRAVDVEVEGGLGGIEIECAIERFHVDNYVCRDISIANNAAHFSGGNMLNLGYGAGLGLGLDDPESAELTKYGYIGSVFIDGVDDNRVQDGSGTIANVDGVRIHAADLNFNSIHVRNVDSHSKSDCVGLYLKAHRCRGDKITIVDAGNHEGMIVFKGARRADPDTTTTGFNVSINEVQLIGTQSGFAGRSGVFCGVDDIHIGRLYMENIGGSVEDPYDTGTRLGGHGALFHTADTGDGPKRRLSVGTMEIINCSLDNPSGTTVRAIDLNGYSEVIMDRIVLDGISQGGGFSGTDGRLILIGVIGSDPFKHCEIGSILEQNTANVGDDTTLFQSDTDASGYGDLIIRNAIVTSDQIDIGIKIIGDAPLALLDISGGDLSRTGVALDTAANRPTKVRIRGVDGLGDQPNINSNNQSGFRARFGVTPPLIFAFDVNAGFDAVTVDRNSVASLITAGGAPRVVEAGKGRLTHDPVTGEPHGLLVEPASTNHCPDSEDLTDTTGNPWTVGSNLNTITGIVDPAGTSKAIRLTASSTVTGTAASEYFRTASAAGSHSSGVASWWIRRITGTGPVHIMALDGDPSSGSLDISGLIDDRWLRVSNSGTTAASFIHTGIAVLTSGDAVEVAFPQMEESTLTDPTSYIPTAGTAVTRVAEDAYIDLTQYEAFRKGGYSMLVEAVIYRIDDVLITVGRGGAKDVELELQSGDVKVTGIYALSLTVPSGLSVGDNIVAAVRVRPDDVAVSVNGSTVQTDTSRAQYGLSETLQLGADINAGDGTACSIRQVAFFGPLDDATLEAMSAS